MISMSQYPLNSRALTTFHPVEDELHLDKNKNYLFDLSYLSVLDLKGEKSIDFLQGQVTCDVHSISDIKMIQGAQCNLKGRVLALLDIINWQGLKLIVPNDLAEPTQNSLAKTALLSRVSIHENNELKVYGFFLQNPEDISPFNSYFPSELYALAYGSNYCYYHLGQGFYLFLIDNALKPDFFQPFIEQDQLLGSLTWHTLMMKQGHIDIYPESRGLFLPHRLGLHQSEKISFNKGCYKGQEIIARMHYKSTIKHELKLLLIKTDSKMYSGQKLMNLTQDAELGELVDYSYLGDNQYIATVSLLKHTDQYSIFKKPGESIERLD